MRMSSRVTTRSRRREHDWRAGGNQLARGGVSSARVMQLLGRVFEPQVEVWKLAVRYDDREPGNTDIETLQSAIQELATAACVAGLNTYCSISLRIAERTEPMCRAGCLPRRALALLREGLGCWGRP